MSHDTNLVLNLSWFNMSQVSKGKKTENNASFIQILEEYNTKQLKKQRKSFGIQGHNSSHLNKKITFDCQQNGSLSGLQ